MTYYMVKLDFYDHFMNRSYIEGEILTEYQVKQKYNFYESDIKHYLIKLETSPKNTYYNFGVRKIKDYRRVKYYE